MGKCKSEILKSYIPLVKFLANYMGADCEVVLHDVNNVETSIIAIENNYISGRQVGAPLTDLSLKIIQDKRYLHTDFIDDYECISKDGKQLRSATYFIKDEASEILGLLCINMDVSNLVHVKQCIDNLVRGFNNNSRSSSNASSEIKNYENISHNSIEDLTLNVIEDVISKCEVSPERMNPDEKLSVVKVLNDKGVFLIKGAVSAVADGLKASEATIYRYIKQITK